MPNQLKSVGRANIVKQVGKSDSGTLDGFSKQGQDTRTRSNGFIHESVVFAVGAFPKLWMKGSVFDGKRWF